ncbi:MAG: PAS domain S-box protein [Candidatus Competibacter denitrificans]
MTDPKQIETMLAESDERLRMLLNAMPDIVCFKDGEGRWLESNENNLRLFQLEGIDYRGKTDSELVEFSPFYREALIACQRSDEQAWAAAQLSRHEEAIPQPDGSSRTFDVIKVPTFHTDGQRKSLLVVGRDITERRQAEAALKESESRYRHLFELESDAVVLVDNQTCQILEANQAMSELYGYSREELLRKKTTDVSAEPEKTSAAAARGVMAGAKALVPIRWHRKRDGTVFPVEINGRFFEWRGRAVHIATIRDITERYEMIAKLHTSEARFRSIFELSPLGIVLMSQRDHRFVQVNRRYCELIGYSPEELRQMTVIEITHPDDRSQTAQLLKAVSEPSQSGLTLQKRSMHKNGSVHWISLTLDMLTDANDNQPLIIGIAEDITERRVAEDQLHHLALHDALTDLPNRVLFKDRLRLALGEAQREQTLLALLFLDLDRFKHINDSLGHAVGDQLLQAVAKRLRHHVRRSDTVCRLGGDEFVVLLTAIHDVSHVAQIAEKLLDGLAAPWRLNEHVLQVSTSIGISLYPQDGDNAEILLQRADMALYQAKANGRNNYQFFTADMKVQVRERL